MKRIWLVASFFILVAIMVGCAGGGTGSPVTPVLPSDDEITLTGNSDMSEYAGSSHTLWGFWQGITNKETGKLEIIPLRGASFHMNMARIIQDSNPVGLSIDINSFNHVTRVLDCDVSITHPIPNSDFRGFDVRGIFMGPGKAISSKLDSDLTFNSPDGCRLLNSDGYTRWWNAVEFTSPGFFGYDDSRIVPGYLIPNTTLNPYKYF